MSIRARSDQDGFDFWISQQVMEILHNALDTKLISHSLRYFKADIAHCRQLCLRNLPNYITAVHAAHATGADYSDLYFSGHLINAPR
jgi:hypothetical protein